MPQKLALAHLPTPLWKHESIDRLVNADVWIKRDDATLGAEAGNKIRKLEYLLAEAREQEAKAVLTCGGLQSNHARATALLAAGLGMRAHLFLRTSSPKEPPRRDGNLLLDGLAGASVERISPQQYGQRAELMQQRAASLEQDGTRAYVIPEGGSNGLGSLGYVDAMREIRGQLDAGLGGGPQGFDAVVHACGSGGTTAGLALGAALYDVAPKVIGIAVCDDRAYFERRVAAIIAEARARIPSLPEPCTVDIRDDFKGPGYGVANDAQKRLLIDVARSSGLVLDPVYTGKAFFGLVHLDPKPPRVLFVHTGGLPGLLAQSDAVSPLLGDPGFR